jgi:nitroimidazol reductase NimA-like FMN-containing flavoprotein (pyridoxamine 5'-phosphate oxidase superfamily)
MVERWRSVAAMPDPRAVRPSMADYGVPADLDGVLPWSWAEERLVRNRNYWVVTASASGRPHALPVWGVWRTDTDGAPGASGLAFSCAPSARNSRNLAENPQACVTVDDTVECVSVEGVARPVTDAAERAAIVDQYARKYAEPDGREELAGFVAQHALWFVTPERAFGIIEREEEFSARATKWVWAS